MGILAGLTPPGPQERNKITDFVNKDVYNTRTVGVRDIDNKSQIGIFEKMRRGSVSCP